MIDESLREDWNREKCEKARNARIGAAWANGPRPRTDGEEAGVTLVRHSCARGSFSQYSRSMAFQFFRLSVADKKDLFFAFFVPFVAISSFFCF